MLGLKLSHVSKSLLVDDLQYTKEETDTGGRDY